MLLAAVVQPPVTHYPSAPSSSPPSPPWQAVVGSPPDEQRLKAMNLDGHLNLATLMPEAGAGAEEPLSPRRHGGGLTEEGMAAGMERQRRAAEAAERLAQEWPHGVPVRGGVQSGRQVWVCQAHKGFQGAVGVCVTKIISMGSTSVSWLVGW